MNISPIENVSFKDIINNIDNYYNLFLKNGLIFFKNANVSPDEQQKISNELAKKIKCNYVAPIDYEDHSFTFKKNNKIYSKNDLFIPWHLEHCEKPFSQVATSWNMVHLSSDYGIGDTGFVNSYELFNRMPYEWKELLNQSYIIDHNKNFPARKCIQKHFFKNQNIIKLSPNKEDKLYSVNNQLPSDKNSKLFLEITNWYLNETANNTDLQVWWHWSEGDLLIVDLSLMAHAVKGGFTLGERVITRNWIFKEESDYLNQKEHNE